MNFAVLAVLVLGAPEPAVTQALALRGGAILLPLRHEAPERGWPSTMRVRWKTPRGTTTATAQLVWVEQQPARDRHWAANPAPSIVRAVRRNDAMSSPGSGGPHLLLGVPSIEGGELRVGSTVVHLQWSDLPPSMPDLRLDTSVPLGAAPALSPSSATPSAQPTERWRWEMLCAVDGLTAPPMPADEFERLVVLHTVGRWRMLMHGLAHLDRGMAREVQEQLTARIEFQGESIAVWETAPDRLGSLLSVQVGDESTRTQALASWLKQATPLTAWLHEPLQRMLWLVVTNNSTRTRLVETAWVQEGAIPVALQVPARGAAAEPLERPQQAIVLGLQADGARAGFSLPSRNAAPEPPGLPIGPFLPVLTLHDARATTQPMPPRASAQTWAQVRRVLGRWEVLLDCRMPTAHVGSPPDSWHLNDLRGHEAVLLRVHIDGQEVTVVVHPFGHLYSSGSSADLKVRIARQDTGWICRVQLPDHWTNQGFGLELARTHAGSSLLETAVMAGSPWAPLPGPVLIDVGAWDQGVPLPSRTVPE